MVRATEKVVRDIEIIKMLRKKAVGKGFHSLEMEGKKVE